MLVDVGNGGCGAEVTSVHRNLSVDDLQFC